MTETCITLMNLPEGTQIPIARHPASADFLVCHIPESTATTWMY
jgi:hypothetical protein